MAQINLGPAYDKTVEEFSRHVPEHMAHKAMVDYEPDKYVFTVPFLGKEYKIYYPGGEVRSISNDQEVPMANQIVMLHYLSQCSNRELEGVKITFKELPSGSIYVGPFNNRCIKPLVSIFGNRTGSLIEAAKKLGGWRENMGDVAVTVPVLPKIPITFVLWEGDDEFPPSGNVLFDASAASHLHTEDYALLPGITIWEMKKIMES